MHGTEPAPEGLRPATHPGPRRLACATCRLSLVAVQRASGCSPSGRARCGGSPRPARGASSRPCGAGGSAWRSARQVTLLGRYIVDLLVPELRLVIEVDGLYHERRRAADARRDRALERAGYQVLRIEADVVMGDLDAAVRLIRGEIDRL